MKDHKVIFGIVFFFLVTLFYDSVKGQIRVDDTSFTPKQLIEDILIDSPCAKVDNITASTGTSIGINGIGYFESNGSNFEIEKGIILSTGAAASAEGPNGIDALSDGSDGWLGDSDLESITSTRDLFNASFIQFDFVPSIDFVSFDFLFASEEYINEFPCTFSDVFAFILTDSSGSSRNLAVLPGTDPPVPIRVTTVNAGADLNNDGDFLDIVNNVSECRPKNEEFFNRTIAPGADSPIDFNGYTKVLKASGNVVPGEKYTIKMVIADNRDAAFDSAVFLAAGSFNIGGDLGDNRTIASGNPGCKGESIILNATIGSSSSYTWLKDGMPLAPGDGATLLAGGAQLEVTQDGVYSVNIDVAGLCTSVDSVEIEFATPPVIASNPEELKSCDIDNDGFAEFNLTKNTSLVLGSQDASIYQVTYHLTKEDAESYTSSSGNRIDTPSSYINVEVGQIIWLRIAESTQTCYKVTSFPIESLPIDPIELETKYTRCIDIDGTIISILPKNIEIELDDLLYDFQWYTGLQAVSGNEIPGETTPVFLPQTSGSFTVEITSKLNGCSISKTIDVEDSFPPQDVTVDFVSGIFDQTAEIEVLVSGNGVYEYKMDRGEWQESSFFDNISKGQHDISVRDIAGCDELTITINNKSGYPEYFTPNGDGFHDTWKIDATENVTISEVSIFDRLGRLVGFLGPNQSWDGTINGKLLPSSAYWFRVLYFESGEFKEFKSNFTLIR